jgi:hypothetical protein
MGACLGRIQFGKVGGGRCTLVASGPADPKILCDRPFASAWHHFPFHGKLNIDHPRNDIGARAIGMWMPRRCAWPEAGNMASSLSYMCAQPCSGSVAHMAAFIHA